MSKTLLAAAILFLAFFGSAFTADQDEPRQFIVSIVRADGTLLPFAQYANGGWMNPWPSPRRPAASIYDEEPEEVIPHSLGNLPEPWFLQCGKIPPKWYFWSSPNSPQVLNASQVLQVDNHSQKNWALLTDFPKQNTKGTHHRNLGVALNVNAKVEPLIQIETNSAEAADLLSFVRQVFGNADNAEMKTLYRSSSRLNGEYLYYFDAQKQHKRSTVSTEPGCNDISIFQGWVSADEKGGMGLFDSRVFLTDCDLKGPSFSTPLGILKLKSSIFLFISEHGWEDESYWILELDKSGLHKVLETYGG